jgi:hypothetical protein
MPSDEPSFWGRMRARVRISRAWLARGVALLVTVALVAGFAALVWRDRAPLAAPIAQSATPTATFVSAETFAPDSTNTPTSGPATTTPVPFVCANAPGSQRMYAFLNHDRQIYRVTGCANPVRLYADQPLGRAFPAPLFSPDGTRVSWTVFIGKTLCQSTQHGAIQGVSGGAVTALPDNYG